MARKKKNSTLRLSRSWHRRIGVFLALPVVVIAMTGIALNHAPRLHLDDVYLSSSAILSFYGMNPKNPSRTFRDGNVWATAIDGLLYVDGKRVGEIASKLIGVVSFQDEVVVATQKELYLVERRTSQLIERMGGESLPDGVIQQIANIQGALVLQTESETVQFSLDLLGYQVIEDAHLPPASAVSLTDDEYRHLLRDWRGKGVSFERVLLDLHSGRLFGIFGVLIVDIAGIALLLLVMSGLFMNRKKG